MKLTFVQLLLASLPILLLLAAGGAQDSAEAQEEARDFEAFGLAELTARAKESGRSYLSFLERDSLSTGLYRLPAGSEDTQSPHALDEVYYVVSGKAAFRAGAERTRVEAGSVLFVAKDVEHRFEEIEEDLEIVVFFSKYRER